jgi:hypothetical protein
VGVDLAPASSAYLRGEPNRLAVVGVVERLDAECVAGEEEGTLAVVPNSEREHPAQRVEHLRAAVGVQVQQNFRVALAAEGATLAFELASQFTIVVDLAVERDHVAPVGAVHRLRPARREVDDRQPPVSEADVLRLRKPKPFAIRPAPDHVIADAHQLVGVHWRGRDVVSIDADYAAHGGGPGITCGWVERSDTHRAELHRAVGVGRSAPLFHCAESVPRGQMGVAALDPSDGPWEGGLGHRDWRQAMAIARQSAAYDPESLKKSSRHRAYATAVQHAIDLYASTINRTPIPASVAPVASCQP